MTIAAGFVHRDGVLLCADTQLEDWEKKIYQAKTGNFSGSWGAIAYAMAGSGDFAAAAIQKLRRSLDENDNPTIAPLAIMERSLDRQYRKTVLSNPDHKAENLDYWLLIGLWDRATAKTRLFATQKTAIHEIDWFRCAGAGEALANHLIRPVFSSGGTEREVLCLAAHALSMAKDKVPGCGGMSLFISLRSDGRIKQFFNSPLVEHIESVAPQYEHECQELLVQHTVADDLEFEKHIAGFERRIRSMRSEWLKIKDRPTMAIPTD